DAEIPHHTHCLPPFADSYFYGTDSPHGNTSKSFDAETSRNQAGKYRIRSIALPRQATSANMMPRPWFELSETVTGDPALFILVQLAPLSCWMSSATFSGSVSPKVVVAAGDNARTVADLSARATASRNVATRFLCRPPARRKPLANPAVPRNPWLAN